MTDPVSANPLPYPQEFYPGCPCYTCDHPTWAVVGGFPSARMSLCPRCGSKRCYGAINHAYPCRETSW